MKIEAYYMDGAFETYDTEAHFNSEHAIGASDCMTVFQIKGTGNIERDGLWISYLYYDCNKTSSVEGHEAECAPLVRSVDIQVLDSDDISRIAWISIDGKKRYFRIEEDDPLIDGFKYEVARDLHLNQPEKMATIEEAAWLFEAMTEGSGGMGPVARIAGEENDDDAYFARIAESMGFAPQTMKAILAAQREPDEEDLIEGEDF